jgi:hypothetical protein
MSARKDVYESIRRNPNVIAGIDGRMGGQQLEIYTYAIKDTEAKKNYKKVKLGLEP